MIFYRPTIGREPSSVKMQPRRVTSTPTCGTLLVATRALILLRTGTLDLQRTAAAHGPILDAVEVRKAARAGAPAFAHANNIAETLDAASSSR
jgi:hypothetical protein